MYTNNKSKMERGVHNVARSIGIDPKVASKAWKNVSDNFSKNRLMKRTNDRVIINMSSSTSPPNISQPQQTLIPQQANINKYALYCLLFFGIIIFCNFIFTKHLNETKRVQIRPAPPQSHYFEEIKQHSRPSHRRIGRNRTYTSAKNQIDVLSLPIKTDETEPEDREDPTLEEKSFKSLRENEIDTDPAHEHDEAKEAKSETKTGTTSTSELVIPDKAATNSAAGTIISDEDKASIMDLAPHSYHSYPFDLSDSENGIYYLAMIADQDKASKISKYSWQSYMQHIKLSLNTIDQTVDIEFIFPPFKYDKDDTIFVDNSSQIAINGYFNEKGRGMELSELVRFDDRMYAFDDRTGIIYEISKEFEAIPRHIAMEGDGNIAKGMKIEWSTYKDDEDLLYFGSIGREYTNHDGTKIKKLDLLWICTLDKEGRIEHIDWTAAYMAIRQMTATLFPGYLWIEAIEWSQIHKKWFIVPRYVSFEKYDEVLTESKGCNLLIIASENFEEIELVWIKFQQKKTKKKVVIDRMDRNLLMSEGEYKSMNDLSTDEMRSMSLKQENMKKNLMHSNKGFSTIRFLPNTNDTVIVGIRTQENNKEVVGSHLSVFDIEGNVYLQSKKIPGRTKYEGIAVL